MVATELTILERHYHVFPNRRAWVLRATQDETSNETNEGCPERVETFWISREPVAWPWCNLAASQRRPYCASVNSHSLVGLVSRQWDAVDWACVLCDRRVHNDRASRSASSRQCACPFYSSPVGLSWQSATSSRSVSTLQYRFGSLRLVALPKNKIAMKEMRFVNATKFYQFYQLQSKVMVKVKVTLE